MFKEIVSLAIILGFILNIIYVAHPNTTSYTIAFVLSLIALSPFLLLWRYWDVLRNRVRKLRSRHQKVDDVEAVGLMSGGQNLALISRRALVRVLERHPILRRLELLKPD
jgi:hypothetical protein